MRLILRAVLCGLMLCTFAPGAAAAETPALETAATDADIGAAIHDKATLSGGFLPTGTITFALYGPDDPDCASPPVLTEAVDVLGNGNYQTDDYVATNAGQYNWTAAYSGDAGNDPASSACGSAGETSTVRAAPALSTSAASTTIGGRIHDTATLSGGHHPTGTITFEAFGPDAPDCDGAATSTESVDVDDNGVYESLGFTPVTAGDYQWRIAYSGDLGNAPASSPCGAVGETSTVARDTPALLTNSSDATIGSPIHDVAALSGGYHPGGTVTFRLYGPGDATCAMDPVFVSDSIDIVGGAADSGNYTPMIAGIYRWRATYSGDANNHQVEGDCDVDGETSTISKFSPTISTTASDATIGQSIHDDAKLTGASTAPSGDVTFSAYGPDDATCSGHVAYTSEAIPVSGSLAGSGHFRPTMPGAYRWKTYYSGDGRNLVAIGACDDPGETSIVKAIPTLAATATDATTGDEIHDTATLSAGHDPHGTITFLVYGPRDANCVDPIFNSGPVDVSGNGSYSSGGFSAPASGAYRWKASYSGDGGNTEASAQCGVNATSTVTAARPTLASVASDATIGGAIHDTAILSGGYRPGGTITFRAFGPANTDCSGTVAFNSGPVKVTGNGFFGSGDFSPPTTGTYRWTVSYSGDAENASASSPCNSPNGISTVALNDVRPADRDADGIPDSIDDCPTVVGPGKTNGCTAIERVLTLKYKRGAFRGTLAPEDACGAEEKVTILAKRHGQTRKVGGARTNAKGRFAITAAKRKGSYYARSLSSLEPTVGLCLATQSKRIIAG